MSRRGGVAVLSAFLLILSVSCRGNDPATGPTNRGEPSSDSFTAGVSTTAYLEEPGSRSGSYLTFSIGKFHIANLRVEGRNNDAVEFLQNWIEQVNSGTAGGSITIGIGSNPLPLADDAWLNCDIRIVNNPVRGQSGFIGPKGSVSWNGSVKARKGFDVDHFHVTNPGTAKIDLSTQECANAGEILTCHVIPTAWDVPGWEWSSLAVTVNNWNSTPENLRQVRNAGIVTNRIQFDAVSNIVSAAQQVTLKQ